MPYLRRSLNQIVLREASRPKDLTGYQDKYADRAMAGVAPARGVRQAWEEHHRRLRIAAAGLPDARRYLHRQVTPVVQAAGQQGFALGGGTRLGQAHAGFDGCLGLRGAGASAAV